MGKLFPIETVIGNGSLTTSYEVLPISWTLIIEAKFYLLCLACLIFRVPLAVVSIFAGTMLVVTDDRLWFFISIMLFGSQLSRISERWVQIFAPLFIVVTLYLAQQAGFFHRSQHLPLREIVWAIIVFCGFIAANRSERVRTFCAGQAVQFLANISYALYCCHFPVIILAYYLLGGSMPPLAIQAISMIAVIPLAYAIHLYIEKPGVLLGHNIPRWSGAFLRGA